MTTKAIEMKIKNARNKKNRGCILRLFLGIQLLSWLYLQERQLFRQFCIVIHLDIVHPFDADMAIAASVTEVVADKEYLILPITMFGRIFHYRVVLVVLLRSKVKR